MRALSNAVEARDAYTGKHAERVAAYGMELAPRRRARGRVPQIEFGFLLHDVGKVAVPDAILFKTGKLTDEEYALIAQHPVIGAEILRDVDFLGEASKLVVATTTSAGTVPATRTVCAARRSRSRRACSRSPTRSTR